MLVPLLIGVVLRLLGRGGPLIVVLCWLLGRDVLLLVVGLVDRLSASRVVVVGRLVEGRL